MSKCDRFEFRLDYEEKLLIRGLANSRGVSMSQFVSDLIREKTEDIKDYVNKQESALQGRPK